MKSKVFGLLMILAMVTNLCVIIAVPSPVFADVDTPTVTPSPATAGSMAQYVIALSPGASGALGAGNTVSVEFPSGTTVPTAIDYRNVLIATSGTTTATFPFSGGVNVSGRKVTIQLPTGYGVTSSGTLTITITQVAGIKNPTVSTYPGDNTVYAAKVNTSVETTQITSQSYTIIDWVSASPMSLAKGQIVTITGAGFKPGATVETPLMLLGGMSPNGAAMGSATVGSDGTFTMTAYGSGYSTPIEVKDGTGRSAQTAAAVTVLPSMTITPSGGIVGSSVVIEVTNLSSAASAATFVDSPATYLTIAGVVMTGGTATASDLDADGTVDDIRWTGSIPQSLTGGVKTVSFTDPGTIRVITATFTVTPQEVFVSPESATPGTRIETSGTGFPPNTSGGVIMAVMAGNPVIASGLSTDSTGAFNAVGTVPPTAVPGNLGLIVVFGSTIQIGYVTVTPRTVTVNPTSGPKGTVVTLSGGGFAYAAAVNDTVSSVRFGDINWNTAAYGGGSTIVLDSLGNMAPTSLVVGNFTIGTNTITVTDELGTGTAIGQFTITVPTCSFEPTEAVRGETVTVTGEGWVPGPSGSVSIFLDVNADGSCTELQTTAIPDAGGNIYAQFTVPTSVVPNTAIYYRANDNKGNASLPGVLTIPPAKIKVSPVAGPSGTAVKATGTGFLPLTGVASLTLGGVSVLPPGTVTSGTGSFTAQFNVPMLAPSTYAVAATVGTTTATTWFTLTSGPVPQSLTTGSGEGGSVTAPGEGDFTYPNGTVTSVVATPDPGYAFLNWTGSGVDAGKVADPDDPSTTITMDADYTLMANFVAPGQIADHVVLLPGWNFISTPTKLSDSADEVQQVFSGINTNGHPIYLYDSSSWTQMGAGDTIRALDGIWVYSASPAVVPLTFDTNPLLLPPTKALEVSWNAIGHSCKEPLSTDSTLYSVESKWAYLIGFDSSTQSYEPSIINNHEDGGSHDEDNPMYPTAGYWLYMASAGELGGLAAGVMMAASGLPLASSAVTASPQLPEAYYGTFTVNGVEVPAGTEIIVRINGEVRGTCTMSESGAYGEEGTFAGKLLVTGNADSDIGGIVTFWIEGMQADQTDTYNPGTVTNLNLTGPGVMGLLSMAVEGNRPDPAQWQVPVTVRLFAPGANVLHDAPLYEFNLTANKSGDATACQTGGVVPGTYDITVVSEHTLMNVKRNIAITTPGITVNMGTLLEGDWNGNLTIDWEDLGTVLLNYDKSDGEEGFDPAADFNRNGCIDWEDLGLALINYDKTSPVEVP